MSEVLLLDRAVIDDLVEHIGLDAARPVFELFIGDSRALIGRIGAAMPDAGGRETIRKAAHSLKSGAGQIGAAALAANAAALEQAAGSGGSDLASLSAALKRSAEETEAALRRFLSRPS